MMVQLTCAHCRKEFFLYPSQTTTRTGPRKYCSLECRGDATAVWARGRCRWCGEKPKRRTFRFCSKPCRGAYQRALRLGRNGPLCAPAQRAGLPRRQMFQEG